MLAKPIKNADFPWAWCAFRLGLNKQFNTGIYKLV